MLFEFEEGTSRKFYRVEREGTKVLVHWGRIGTAGQKKTLEFASEAEAQKELDAQILKRRERGYRAVIDESAPRDAEAARTRSLAKARPLGESPRFLFVHPKRRRFVWLEASGGDLLTAEGPVGREAEAEPTSESCGSPAAAVRKRDAAIAKLMAQGFALSQFAAAEPKPVRKAPNRRPIAENPALEEHVAEAPGDAARWAVLEDWILEQGDPRCALIEAERGGSRGDAAQERGKILGPLLGPKSGLLVESLQDVDWRAGFVRACTLRVPFERHEAVYGAFLAAPALRLMHTLDLSFELSYHEELPWPQRRAPPDVLVRLAGARFARCLRSLDLQFPWSEGEEEGALAMDGALLDSMPRLRRLAARGIRLVGGLDPLARLERFEWTAYSRDDLLALLAPGVFPNLRELVLSVRAEVPDALDLLAAKLAPLANLQTAPRLERLEVQGPTLTTSRRLFDALRASPLLRRLRRLSLGYTKVDRHLVGRLCGEPFAHLEELTLPWDPAAPNASPRSIAPAAATRRRAGLAPRKVSAASRV
ncbi:MAG: WGR domain-containing protein [Myxococcales bacterium]